MKLHRMRSSNGNLQQFRNGIGLLCGLLLASISCAATPAQTAQQPRTAIIFYAQAKVSEELWPELFQTLRGDLTAGIRELPSGVALGPDPVLLRGRDLAPGNRLSGFSIVIEVRLEGRCDVVPQASRPLQDGPLGWVLQVAGEIQPFIFIDCTRLAQVLTPAAFGLDREGRQHAMAQAVAHVLIHEWVHVATQSAGHGRRGITQPSLSTRELMADPPGPSRSPASSRSSGPSRASDLSISLFADSTAVIARASR